jgi:two-component system OmpR family sensor kinase
VSLRARGFLLSVRAGRAHRTFGEHLNSSHQRIGEPIAIGYSSFYPPNLPAQFPITANNLMYPRVFTVAAAGDPDLSYRVIAKSSDLGYGTTIIAVPVNGVDASLARLEKIEAIVIASVLGALAILAWFLIRLGLRPLDRMGATAGAIAAGDLSRRVSPEDPRTEVGRLGWRSTRCSARSSRRSRERQASEDRLRRFLSDASHELRTPLTSIRGYAELFRMGATTSPEDIAKAMAADRGGGGAHGNPRRGAAGAGAAGRDARRPCASRSTSSRWCATPPTTRARRQPTARSVTVVPRSAAAGRTTS